LARRSIEKARSLDGDMKARSLGRARRWVGAPAMRRNRRPSAAATAFGRADRGFTP
jgi:hypothetical protein